MGEISLWERERVPRHEVPTLQEVFAWCDRDALVRSVVGRCIVPDSDQPGVSSGQKRDMALRVSSVLDDMSRMRVKRKGGNVRMLLPAVRYVVRADGAMERRIGMRLLVEADVLGPVCGAEQSAASALPQRPCALEPWENLLSCDVWLGGAWSVGERYGALASTFWDMTYFGFTARDVATGQAAWRARCGDMDPWEQEDASSFSGASSVKPRPPSSAAEFRAKKAEGLGLLVVDSLEDDVRAAVLSCAKRLNRRSERDLRLCFMDALRRMGRMNSPDAGGDE